VRQQSGRPDEQSGEHRVLDRAADELVAVQAALHIREGVLPDAAERVKLLHVAVAEVDVLELAELLRLAELVERRPGALLLVEVAEQQHGRARAEHHSQQCPRAGGAQRLHPGSLRARSGRG